MEIKNIIYKAQNSRWVEEEPEIIQSNPFETVAQIPKSLGEGETRTIQIRDGLSIGLINQRPTQSFMCDVKHNDLLELSFLLSGKMEVFIPGTQERCTARSGVSGLVLARPGFTIEVPANRPILIASLLVQPALIYSFVEDNPGLMLEGLINALNGPQDEIYCHEGAITPAIQFAIQQIISCPLQGPLRQIYLESKALELLALRLDQLNSHELNSNRPKPLAHRDIEKIHYAKDLLMDNMENPPSLLELSKQVGLNDFKLKKGFREVMGNTVFGYLREQRMAKAHRLLEEGKMNVTEVLYGVGYNDPSHFCSEFKKRFGRTPSSLIN